MTRMMTSLHDDDYSRPKDSHATELLRDSFYRTPCTFAVGLHCMQYYSNSSRYIGLRIISMNHSIAIYRTYCESNGHVADDVTWPKLITLKFCRLVISSNDRDRELLQTDPLQLLYLPIQSALGEREEGRGMADWLLSLELKTKGPAGSYFSRICSANHCAVNALK